MRLATYPTGFLVLHLLTSTASIQAQSSEILLDGFFEDWSGLDPVHIDPQDQPGGGIDFERLWITNDDRFVFFSIVVGVDEISLQNGPSISLYIDTDDDALTGEPVAGVGADLVWHFGALSGTFYGDAAVTIGHRDVGLLPAPTVTSTRFELGLDLEATPRRQGPLFPGDTIAVVIQASAGQDVLPDPGGRVEYVIDRNVPPRSYGFELDRELSTDLRILAWNVLRDGLFDSNLTTVYSGLLEVMDPDIIGFSEIYDHSPSETLDRLETLLPSEQDERWFGDGSGFDVVLASRYPVVRSFKPLAGGAAGAFLIDLSSRGAGEILVVAAHLRCCENDVQRQLQIDEIMAFIRDIRTDGTLEEETPIVVLGDMNFVGESSQLTTLTQGEIETPRFQPSFDPDWDGSPFTDRIAQTTGVPAAFTWPGRGESFSPGRLDLIVYSDFVLEPGRAYALNAETIPLDVLQQLGLSASATIRASDHLPVVADFRGPSVTAQESDELEDLPAGGERIRLRAFPNPATHLLHVDVVDSGGQFSAVISLFDVLGREVAGATSVNLHGIQRATFDVGHLPAGIYVVRGGTASGLQIGGAVVTIR